MTTETNDLSATERLRNLADAAEFQIAAKEIQNVDLSYRVQTDGRVAFDETCGSSFHQKEVYFNIFKWVFGVCPHNPAAVAFGSEAVVYDVYVKPHSKYDEISLRATNKHSARFLLLDPRNSASEITYGVRLCKNRFWVYGGDDTGARYRFLDAALRAIPPLRLVLLLIDYFKARLADKDKLTLWDVLVRDEDDGRSTAIEVAAGTIYAKRTTTPEGEVHVLDLRYLKASEPIGMDASSFVVFAGYVNVAATVCEENMQKEADEKAAALTKLYETNMEELRRIHDHQSESVRKGRSRLDAVFRSIHK